MQKTPPWNTLKQEPASPTLTHLKVWLERQVWLAKYRVGQQVLAGIPAVKIQHFAAEAKTLDAARMLEMEPRKRLTLAVSLLNVQSARVLDDLAEMLIKRMASIHQKGKAALADYQARNQQRTDELVQTLRVLVTAYRTEGSAQERGQEGAPRRWRHGCRTRVTPFFNAAKTTWLTRVTTIFPSSGAFIRAIGPRFFGC